MWHQDFSVLTPSVWQVFPCLRLHKWLEPWHLVADVTTYAEQPPLNSLDGFHKRGEAFIHSTAVVEDDVRLRGFAIISAGCFVASGAYLRGGVLLGLNTHVGPNVELKSVICAGNSAIAHLSYVGNTLVGQGVNIEAGAVVANHLNEAVGTTIKVIYNGHVIDTGLLKFGALIGDDVKIGANSVLSPGTILIQGTVVPRLTLVEQHMY
jgi:NDP-sugar pyrophosphorylase family protein